MAASAARIASITDTPPTPSKKEGTLGVGPVPSDPARANTRVAPMPSSWFTNGVDAASTSHARIQERPPYTDRRSSINARVRSSTTLP